MFSIIILSTLIHSALQTSLMSKNESNRNFIHNTYKYDTIINVLVNETTEQILDFSEDTDLYRGYPSRVHVSTNDSLDGQYPLFITATQQKGVSSWELPLAVRTPRARAQFDGMARTLCPHDAGPNITSENRPLIHITTSNPKNVSVDIKVRRVRDFYIEVDKEIALNVTPSTPKYYYFSFDTNPWNSSYVHNGFLPRFNYTIPKSVILMIDSDDDVCAAVSIQNNSCPVFDNEKDMLYQGYHLTMSRKGGITLTQSMFPVGFYVVFIVKQSDEECTGASETATPAVGWGGEWATGTDDSGRVKSFRFRVVATISYKEYAAGALVTLALAALIAMFALVVYIPTCERSEVALVEDASAPSASYCEEPPDDAPIIGQDARDTGAGAGDDASDSEGEWAGGAGVAGGAGGGAPTVADLCRARPAHCRRRSDRYFWSALTVAVVYALPVVQLLATYQHMVFQTGDQDLCYYNFLCAHPLGPLSDFNHVYSNVNYVILGLVFLMQVRARARPRPPQSQRRGIPQQSGLFYSMGLALCMEGVLSACYHLCPNKMNFQFDSSFMYVIAVVCMVQLYQNRHPDVNASAHATFMLLAAIMAVGVVGIMYPSVYFWALFTALHLGACFYLTMKIYYFGRFRLEAGAAGAAWRRVRAAGVRALRPRHGARALLLALANAANWALAAYGLYEHKKDLARHLLAILMGNTVLYTAFYVAMKLIHRERILVHTWCYFALAHAAWALAVSLFLDSKTKWSETPAGSRRHNAPCAALQFYDSHDLWHAASAAALFFSFNMLLTVDDALRDTPRNEIPVF